MVQASISRGRFFWCCISLLSVMFLAACLPESEGVREKELAAFVEGEASNYAAALSSYATQSKASLMASSAYQDGTLQPGVLGRSSDGSMAHAYCMDGAGGSGMLVTWYVSDASKETFALKGLGERAGSAITQEMSRLYLPSTVGSYRDGKVMLRAPNSSGESEISISGCGAEIAAGAPVMIAENIVPGEQEVAGTSAVRVHKTEPCENGKVGLTTYYCEKSANEACSEGSAGWKVDESASTCNGIVEAREITFDGSSTNNLIGAMSGNPGALAGALQGLNVDCLKTGRKNMVDKGAEEEGTQTPAQGSQEPSTVVDSCTDNKLEIVSYQGPSETVRNDTIESTERVEAGCTGDPAGTKGARMAWNGTVYSGTMAFTRWRGALKPAQNIGATYYRYIYDATAENPDGGRGHADSSQRGEWIGDKLSCRRNETMTIACNEMFPQYRSGHDYEPIRTGGITFERVNKVDGWKNGGKGLRPNDPLGRDDEWAKTGVDCSWDEVQRFGCSGPGSQVQQGIRKRRIRVQNNLSTTIEDWRRIQPAVCQTVNVTSVPCPAPPPCVGSACGHDSGGTSSPGGGGGGGPGPGGGGGTGGTGPGGGGGGPGL